MSTFDMNGLTSALAQLNKSRLFWRLNHGPGYIPIHRWHQDYPSLQIYGTDHAPLIV